MGTTKKKQNAGQPHRYQKGENHRRGRPQESMELRKARFVAEYLKDFHGGRAALAAGYSPTTASTMASKLLRDPQVIVSLQAEIEKAKTPNVLSLQEALEILTAIARSRLGEYINEHGDIDIEKVRKFGGAALAEFARDMLKGRAKIKLRDPIMAIERIAKLLGWDSPEQVHVTGDVVVMLPVVGGGAAPEGGPPRLPA